MRAYPDWSKENMNMNNNPQLVPASEQEDNFQPSRRRFFQLAGGIAGVGLLVASCRRTPASDTYIGEGDVALLNYLYILKQVTSAFYNQAVATNYHDITSSEVTLQIDLRDQEVAHKGFLKTLLGKDAAKDIVPDLSQVTFIDKTSFLTHAGILEDLSVAAYNGAIKVMQNTEYILALGQIAAVDARHAGYVHDVLSHNSNGLDSTGMDGITPPAAGFNKLTGYIQTRFDSSKLPTY